MNGDETDQPEHKVKKWDEHGEDWGQENAWFAFEEVSCDFEQDDGSLELFPPAAKHHHDKESPYQTKNTANNW